MKHSLWGAVQSCDEYAPHVYYVTTAGHGGFMIAEATARKVLSPEAIALAQWWNGYLCYEEDCLWAIVGYEHPEWCPYATKDQAVTTLKAWYPAYCLAKGI